MEKIKILIVEDEVLIAHDLASKLTNAGYDITAIADTAEKALNSFQKIPSDLALMDIRLKGSMDGIQTAKKIKEIKEIPIIFITDFEDAFTFNSAKESRPFAFLNKPFMLDTVLRTIELALAHRSSSSHPTNVDNQTMEYIFIPEKNGMSERVKVSEILCIEAKGSYCKVETVNKDFLCSFPMNRAFEQIRSPRFIRVHRSFVVNLDKIERINGNTLDLGKCIIQMSSAHREEVMSKIHLMKGS